MPIVSIASDIAAKKLTIQVRAGSPALPPWGCCADWRKIARQFAQLASIRRLSRCKKRVGLV